MQSGASSVTMLGLLVNAILTLDKSLKYQNIDNGRKNKALASGCLHAWKPYFNSFRNNCKKKVELVTLVSVFWEVLNWHDCIPSL